MLEKENVWKKGGVIKRMVEREGYKRISRYEKGDVCGGVQKWTNIKNNLTKEKRISKEKNVVKGTQNKHDDFRTEKQWDGLKLKIRWIKKSKNLKDKNAQKSSKIEIKLVR